MCDFLHGLIPSLISSLRVAALPLLLYLYNQGSLALCIALFACAVSTDFFDGYAARRLQVTSRFGAYYDGATDFTLIMGFFGFFFLKGIYPMWLLLLITISFVQFLVTSHYAKKLYDPIGKYMGSALYIGVVLTLIFPMQPTYDFVQYAFTGFFAVSLGSRIISLTEKRR
jgi:phosphatidylglycerophosphate synthase